MASIKVRVNRGSQESLTRQITNQLTRMIETGVVAAGSMLPSERTLADAAGVARNVVRRSYDYLTAGGHVESAGRRGRRVRARTSEKRSAASASTAAAKKGSATSKGSKRASAKGSKKKSAAGTSGSKGSRRARGRSSR